jgi:hypothetical protein
MAKWLVYGGIWFADNIEADSQEEAEAAMLMKFMDMEGVRFHVEHIDSELTYA